MSEAMKRLDEPGAWLCHYTRAETAFAHILPGGNLLMNSYAKMRDPFENKRPMFRSAGSYGDKSDDELRLFWMLQAEVGRSRDAWSLLSLTQGDDRESHRAITPFYRNPWSRPRMWEQYAENHAGACLIFAREALIEALRRNLAAKGRYYEGEVSYTPTGFADSAAGAILLDQFHEHSQG